MLVAKGKSLKRFALGKGSTTKRTELAPNLVGPTGNLRAPAIRRKSTLVVGFNPEALEELMQ